MATETTRDDRELWRALPTRMKFRLLELGLVSTDEHTGRVVLSEVALVLARQAVNAQEAAKAGPAQEGARS